MSIITPLSFFYLFLCWLALLWRFQEANERKKVRVETRWREREHKGMYLSISERERLVEIELKRNDDGALFLLQWESHFLRYIIVHLKVGPPQ